MSNSTEQLVLNSDGLFLVSTPLHLLVSLAIIGKEGLKNPVLWFIDQDMNASSLFRDELASWTENPFVQVDLFARPSKKLLKKKKERKATFQTIAEKISFINPKRVFVGNDRRIEFQYLMHLVSGSPVTGVYMDEGIFTYAGRTASSSFSDRIIDDIAKKLSYGSWWVTPKTVGESHYIHTIYASLPQRVHPLLLKKHSVQLSKDYWECELLQSYCFSILSSQFYDAVKTLSSIDVLVSLPHESILKSSVFSSTQLRQYILSEIEKGKHVAVKYHPRDVLDDSLLVENLGALLLPKGVAFEVMLPCLKSDILLIGQLSTPLITAKLLRPEIEVNTLGSHSDVPELLKILFNQLGIQKLEFQHEN